MQWPLVFPLISSLLYVAGVLLIKRAADLKVGALRTTVVCNLMAALIFLVLLPKGGNPIVVANLWQPSLAALLFLGGQLFSFLALQKGDVSVATPAMGVKTILVGWFSVVLLAVDIPWQLWLSAVMTFLAIGLLNAKGGAAGGEARRISKQILVRTILLSLLAAVCYASFDVLVQRWAPVWGLGHFLPLMFGICAFLSLGFVPFFRAPLTAIPRGAWPWLLGGALLMGLQALSLVTAIAAYGDATAMNVIYGARGLWSVAAVWLLGHWFHNTEQNLPPRILRLRLIGAAIMTAAIIVTLLR